MPRRPRRALRSVFGACTEMPSTMISPQSIRSKPLMQRISVLLPDPDGPHTTTTEPFATDALQSSSTRKEPKDFVTFRISIIGAKRRRNHASAAGRVSRPGSRNIRRRATRCQGAFGRSCREMPFLESSNEMFILGGRWDNLRLVLPRRTRRTRRPHIKRCKTELFAVLVFASSASSAVNRNDPNRRPETCNSTSACRENVVMFLIRDVARSVVVGTAIQLAIPSPAIAQAAARDTTPVLLAPARVFDAVAGVNRDGWVVLVRGNRIAAVGPHEQVAAPPNVRRIELPNATLLPGLIDAHSHLFLHPYAETPWADQVLREALALRVARATVAAQRTLEAGFTTLRDLGTEGAGYADVGLEQAIDQGIVPGPRLLVATRAIVATGSYGPGGFAPGVEVPQGAQEADGVDGVTRAVRDQIKHGARWIKVYADAGWGPDGETETTFTQRELDAAVDAARSSGRLVTAHARFPLGIERAVRAGVTTIEHGDSLTPDIMELLVRRGVAICPTLTATEAGFIRNGWRKGVDPVPPDIALKHRSFRAAPAARVPSRHG